MSDVPPEAEPRSGQRRHHPRAALTTVEIAALAISVVWLLALGAGFLTLDSDGGLAAALRLVLVVAGAVLPLVVIWLTAVGLRSLLALREEMTRLHQVAESLRRAQMTQAPVSTSIRPSHNPPPSPQGPAGRPAAAGARPEPTARRSVAKERDVPQESQPSLKLDMSESGPSEAVAPSDFVRALGFPADPEDREGFRALRRARADRQTADLLQASQDLLTLLSEDGIYMEDLTPDPAAVEAWRRFARGERGRSMAALGGVRDEEVVEAVTARMRRDAIFRDAAHHFLRRFDRILAEFEPQAEDADLADLADTRTARAFMLVAQASGTFD